VDVTEYLLYLYAESPVHTGAADSVDVLDLPIQREAATAYPVIWGQSLKGALRQAATDAGAGQGWDQERIKAVFGSSIEYPDEHGGTTPGTLAVGDAQLVAMPVPALRNTFAWATSEVALGRLARKYKLLHQACPELPEVAGDRGLAASQAWTEAEHEVLGPCLVPLGPGPSELLARWADRIAGDVLDWDGVFRPFAGKLRADLLLAGSGIISVLLSECTEQAVRVQLSGSRTVKNGPFYSEYLPAETIMAALLTLRGDGDTDPNRRALADLLDKQPLQIGGDETLGKGLMWARLLDGRTA
jgi:CRISPR-associated protein Cmr4